MKTILLIVAGVFCVSAFLTVSAYLSMWLMEWLFWKIFFEEDDE